MVMLCYQNVNDAWHLCVRLCDIFYMKNVIEYLINPYLR